MKAHEIDNDNVSRIIIDSISATLEIDVKLLTVLELKSYNWSYVAWVFVDATANKKKYVIKIPKINNQQTITDAFHNKENTGQSFKEFQCLERLYSNTEQNNKVTVVRPLCYLSDINGILLEKMRGDKLFELIKGNINKTLALYLKKNSYLKISLLHLDLDVYSPTLFALRKLYKYVSKGGVVLIDDYATVKGATEAVDIFVKKYNIKLKKKIF